ncbi:MAG: T9SS type A sorting domain-containing protein [Lachnoclostridium sp.]|nr:T9SS type A sorting domain-containing protein [Lachnoclostridium sp.]
MTKKTVLLWCAAAAASLPVMADEPQLHFHLGGDSPQVVKISELSRITFKSDGLQVTTTEDSFIPYSDLHHVAFYKDAPTGINTIKAKDSKLKVVSGLGRTSITLEGIGETPTDIYIYNMSGRLALHCFGHDGSSIDVSTLPSGVYVIKANSSSVKFIK